MHAQKRIVLLFGLLKFHSRKLEFEMKGTRRTPDVLMIKLGVTPNSRALAVDFL